MSSRHHQDSSWTYANDETDQLHHASDQTPTTASLPTTLFIGGIPRKASQAEVKRYLTGYGPLAKFSMPYSKYAPGHNGYCKVVFADLSVSVLFLTKNDHVIRNTSVGVSIWVKREEFTTHKEQPSENKIFFKFKNSLTESEVKNFFEQYGSVESVSIKLNRVTDRIRDFGFVVFDSAITANKILAMNTEFLVNNKIVRVYPSRSQNDLNVINEEPYCNKKQRQSALFVSDCPQKLDTGSKNVNSPPLSSHSLKPDINNEPLNHANYHFKISTSNMYPQDTTSRQARVPTVLSAPVSMLAKHHSMKPCSRGWHHHTALNNSNDDHSNIRFNICSKD